LPDRLYTRVRKYPAVYALLGLLKGKQAITLDYPVSPRPRYGFGRPSHHKLQTLLDHRRDRYTHELNHIAQNQLPLLNIPDPWWTNNYLPVLDAISLYSFTARRNPRTYFEIGSGVSTRFVRRAITDQKLPSKITSLDPQPRAEIDQLCDTLIRQPLEQIDLSVFNQLTSDDILFVDNSHQSFQNSDATVFFLDILPNLNPGVLIGIHDILLPDDYPPSYAQNYYSEQYLLAAYLLGGAQGIEIVLPNWFVSQDKDLSSILKPLLSNPAFNNADHHGSIFWFQTTSSRMAV
jgi:hypothetical protein